MLSFQTLFEISSWIYLDTVLESVPRSQTHSGGSSVANTLLESLPGFTWILFSRVLLSRGHSPGGSSVASTLLETLPGSTWILFSRMFLGRRHSPGGSSVADTLLETLPGSTWILFSKVFCSRECSSVADTLLEVLRSQTFSCRLPGSTWILISRMFCVADTLLEVLPSQTPSMPLLCFRSFSSRLFPVANILLETLPGVTCILFSKVFCSRECSSVADTLQAVLRHRHSPGVSAWLDTILGSLLWSQIVL